MRQYRTLDWVAHQDRARRRIAHRKAAMKNALAGTVVGTAFALLMMAVYIGAHFLAGWLGATP